MKRRTFIMTTIGAAAAATLPLVAASESYRCPCGLVQYFRKPEGYFAASHIFIDGQRQRFTYGLFKRHEELHRKLGIGTGKA